MSDAIAPVVTLLEIFLLYQLSLLFKLLGIFVHCKKCCWSFWKIKTKSTNVVSFELRPIFRLKLCSFSKLQFCWNFSYFRIYLRQMEKTFLPQLKLYLCGVKCDYSIVKIHKVNKDIKQKSPNYCPRSHLMRLLYKASLSIIKKYYTCKSSFV